MKHTLDTDHSGGRRRLKRFTELERRRKVASPTEKQRRTPKGMSAAMRLRRFLEIERRAT